MPDYTSLVFRSKKPGLISRLLGRKKADYWNSRLHKNSNCNNSNTTHRLSPFSGQSSSVLLTKAETSRLVGDYDKWLLDQADAHETDKPDDSEAKARQAEHDWESEDDR